MNDISGTIEVLPTDRRGRVIVGKERRTALLEEFDRQGVSAARFAAWSGIKYQTFCGWLQRRRKIVTSCESVVSAGSSGGQWVEAIMDRTQGDSLKDCEIIVDLPGGARATLGGRHPVATLARLLCELEALGGPRS